MKLAIAAVLLFAAASQAQLFGFGKPFSSSKTCQSSDDCKPTECCLHGLFGKRFLFDGFNTGVCAPRAKEGEMCVPFNTKVFGQIFGETHFATCPCLDGLVCTSDQQKLTHQFGTIEQHTNAMCSPKEEEEGSGMAA